MLPFEIPAGTTLAKLVEEVVPAAHARLVPASAGREKFTCAFELEGEKKWVVDLEGQSMKVRADEVSAPDARIRAKAIDAQAFLDDWTGPQKLVPKQRGRTDVVLMSDPRLLKRIKMVTGAVELAIRDFSDGGSPRRVSIAIAVGAPAKKEDPKPDVVIETSMKTYLRLLAGGMGPEDALADGDVSVQGKRLVAMQFAFAVAPLFPPK
jgi:putative sterol carrier protein